MVELIKLRSLRHVLFAALASVGTSSAANAGAILVPTGGNIDATILVTLTGELVPVYEANPSLTFADVRGSASVAWDALHYPTEAGHVRPNRPR